MPKHLWDATDKVRMAFGTANTARACCPGSRLTNTESCLAARTAQHWADRQRETACICQFWHCSGVLGRSTETRAAYINMHACHAASRLFSDTADKNGCYNADHLLVRAISLVRKTICLVSCWALLSQKAAHCMHHCIYDIQIIWLACYPSVLPITILFGLTTYRPWASP